MAADKSKQLIDTAGCILEDVQNLITRARPPKGGPDRLRVGLALTIAEQFEATLRLARADMCTHAATHVRSMIEALVAMKMLGSDSGYADKMTYEKLRGEQRVYKGILDDPNIPEPMKAPIKDRYAACKAECDTFRAAGHKPKKITDDFGSAGLSHLVGPYSMLCAFSHNDLAVLAFRHEGDSGMIYKKGGEPKFLVAIVTTAVQVVMVAVDQLGQIAKFPDDHFGSTFAAMNQRWSSIFRLVGDT